MMALALRYLYASRVRDRRLYEAWIMANPHRVRIPKKGGRLMGGYGPCWLEEPCPRYPDPDSIARLYLPEGMHDITISGDPPVHIP